jgi:hypothetical protein
MKEIIALLSLQCPATAVASSIFANFKYFADLMKLNVSLRLDTPARIEDLNTALLDLNLSVAMVIFC